MSGNNSSIVPHSPSRNVISCILAECHLSLQALANARVRCQREKSSKRKGIIFTLSLLDGSNYG